jgi:hypothetical protein
MECRPPEFSSERVSLCPASELSRARRASARALPPQVCRVTSQPPPKSTYHSSHFHLPLLLPFHLDFFHSLRPISLRSANSNLALCRTGCAYLRTAGCFLHHFSRQISTLLGSPGVCALPLVTALPVPGSPPPPAEFAYSSVAPRSSSQAPFLRPASIPPTVHSIWPSAPCAPSRLDPEFLGIWRPLQTANGTRPERCSVPTQPMSPSSQ